MSLLLFGVRELHTLPIGVCVYIYSVYIGGTAMRSSARALSVQYIYKTSLVDAALYTCLDFSADGVNEV